MIELLKNLSEDQSNIGVLVFDKAQEMGIDPRLALALAFQESSLDPRKVSDAGAIGVMQVLPSTAKMLGYSEKDLRDTNKNIEIGLKYLKQGIDKFNDPMLAVAGYHAGMDHKYFTDPDKNQLPQPTIDHVNKIFQLGGFSQPSMGKKESAPIKSTQDQSAAETTRLAEKDREAKEMIDLRKQKETEDFMAMKRRQFMDAAGAGAGAVIASAPAVGKFALQKSGGLLRNLVSRNPQAAAGALSSVAQQIMPQASVPPAATPPAMAPGVRPSPLPVTGGPAGPISASPMVQQGGSGTFNYGKAFGLTDVEAARALDMSKRPGGAQDLIAQRTAGLGRVAEMGGGYVENPLYGGIMTPDTETKRSPRVSFTQTPSGMSQLPPTQPIPTTQPPPPQPSALSRLGSGVTRFLGSAPVSGALGGLSVAESVQELDKRHREGDTVGQALAGLGVAGGLAQLAPHPVPKYLGMGASAISPLSLYLWDKMGRKMPIPQNIGPIYPTHEMLRRNL